MQLQRDSPDKLRHQQRIFDHTFKNNIKENIRYLTCNSTANITDHSNKQITQEEIRSAIKMVGGPKAAGCDDIPQN